MPSQGRGGRIEDSAGSKESTGGRRSVQRRLGQDQVTELVLAYQAGQEVGVLAERYGIHRTTVLGHLKRRGVRRRRSRAMPADIDKAVRLYRASWSVEAIAHELRLGATIVRRVLRQAGVELRGQGRPTQM